MTLIITAIVIQTIIKIELPLIKSYFKINSPVLELNHTQSPLL
ncbi:hypothetical protein BQ8769_63 [Escherichia coli]|uniref:Uncharacterized protein n=1 Tax=Escherichia coli TaxID=562 RepID=A0A1W1EM66_ECOLX|nr:hypothetical protein BQ8769_63 [Escherichia coli]